MCQASVHRFISIVSCFSVFDSPEIHEKRAELALLVFTLRLPLSSHYFWSTQFAQLFRPGHWVCAFHFVSVPFHVMPRLGALAHVCGGQSRLEHY